MEISHFDWDKNKAVSNQKKHNISFEEATSAFLDPLAILLPDPEHSLDEDRFILLGESYRDRLLMVCHCIRGVDEVVRIISARKATKQEKRQYFETEV